MTVNPNGALLCYYSVLFYDNLQRTWLKTFSYSCIFQWNKMHIVLGQEAKKGPDAKSQ